MKVNITLPDSYKELVESKTDDELSILLQHALLFPSVIGQLKMLEAIGLTTLQSILEMKKSGVSVVREQPAIKGLPDDASADLSVDGLDLDALDFVKDQVEAISEDLNNKSVFGKLRAQILKGVDLGV